MKQYLKKSLKSIANLEDEWTTWQYSEDINENAITNKTNHIYKVGVLCAIDDNKCNWVHIIIGTQQRKQSNVEIKGNFYFKNGENDDIYNVINRMFSLLKLIHPVFDE